MFCHERVYATFLWASLCNFNKICKPLVILLDDVISLPVATSYDNIDNKFICSVLCVKINSLE